MRRTLAIFAACMTATVFAMSARAEDRHVGDACRAALSRDWSRVATPAGDDAKREALARFPALRAACANDPIALGDLALAEADDDFHLHKPQAALAALDAHKPAADRDNYATAEWLYLSAAEAAGDAARFRKERDAFLAAHDAALRKRPGIVKLDGFETAAAVVSAYKTASPREPYLFIAAPKTDSEPASLVVHAQSPPGGPVSYGYTAHFCWESGPTSADDLPENAISDFTRVKASVVTFFSQNRKFGEFDTVGMFAPFSPGASREQPCGGARDVLPAFADAAPLSGTEYAAAGAVLSEGQLERMLQGSSEQKNQAIAYLELHPDAVAPFGFIYMIGDLMARGDRARAAFWYYVYQIRIAPWKTPHGDPNADANNEIYGAIAETLGRPINEWAGSDFESFRNLMVRASFYERKIALYPGRPDGIDEKEWAKRIAASRASHDPAALDKAVPDTPEMRQKSETARKANGFYVGPWQSPGAPLPDDWR